MEVWKDLIWRKVYPLKKEVVEKMDTTLKLLVSNMFKKSVSEQVHELKKDRFGWNRGAL